MFVRRLLINALLSALVLSLACGPARAQGSPAGDQYCTPGVEPKPIICGKPVGDVPKDAFGDARKTQGAVSHGFRDEGPSEPRPAFAEEPAGGEGGSAAPAAGSSAEGYRFEDDGFEGKAASATGNTDPDAGSSGGPVPGADPASEAGAESEPAADTPVSGGGVSGDAEPEARAVPAAQDGAVNPASASASASSAGTGAGPEADTGLDEGHDATVLPETGGAPGLVGLAAALSLAGSYLLARRVLSTARN